MVNLKWRCFLLKCDVSLYQQLLGEEGGTYYVIASYFNHWPLPPHFSPYAPLTHPTCISHSPYLNCVSNNMSFMPVNFCRCTFRRALRIRTNISNLCTDGKTYQFQAVTQILKLNHPKYYELLYQFDLWLIAAVL